MMRLQRGIVLSLLATSVAFAACKSSTSSSNPCADFQGTWTSEHFVYTALADTTVSVDLRSLGALISLTVDNSCNYTGTASIPTITTGTANINGDFTLDSDSTLTLHDATAVGAVINNTYDYTLGNNQLILINPSTTFDFGTGTAVPAKVTITFVKS
jgi:hypothetical protein